MPIATNLYPPPRRKRNRHLHVGLVQVSTTNPRCYEALDSAAFLAGVKTLMESAPALELTADASTADATSTRKKLTLKSKPKKA